MTRPRKILILGLAFLLLASCSYVPEATPTATTAPSATHLAKKTTTTTETPSIDKTNAIPQEYRGKLQIFLLAGQSNMSGMGDLSKATIKPDPRIYVFANDYKWKLAEEPIDDASGQVDIVSADADAGFSPALAFASVLLEHDPALVIGLVPCAKGGSSIHEWSRDLGSDTLYGSCLRRAKEAAQMGQIAGMLFYQGETDAQNPALLEGKELLPEQWAEQFTKFVSDLRMDLSLPSLPVVFAQIGKNFIPDYLPNWETVRRQQEFVQMENVVMIYTEDLPISDSVHFTAAGYELLGRRFAKAYLQLTQP